MKRRYLVTVIPLAVAALVAPFFWMKMPDDSYIYMRFARNYVENREIAFNSGQALVGFTSWFHFLILVVLQLLVKQLDIAVYILGLFLHTLTVAFLMVFILCRLRTPGISYWILATFPLWIGFDNTLLACIGMESGWLATGIIACWTLHFNGRKQWAIILASWLIWIRPDAALLPPVLLIDYIVRRKKVPWTAVAVLGTSAVLWMGMNWLAVDSLVPSTLAAKRAQGASGLFGRGFGAKILTGGFPRHEKQYLYYLLLAIPLLLFLSRTLWSRTHRQYAILPVWAVIYFAAYSALNVPYLYQWYYTPLIVAVYLMASLGAIIVAEAIEEKPGKHRRLYFCLVAAWMIFPWFLLRSAIHDQHIESRRQISDSYVEAAEYIRDNTPPSSTIAMVEIGVVGYHIPNTVIDLAGIVSPSILEHLMNRHLGFAFQSCNPDYVLVHDPPSFFEAPVVTGSYAMQYQAVYAGTRPGGAFGPIRILRRKDH